MLERVIYALLYICGIALCFFLITWVLSAIGLHIPSQVEIILMVMMVLVAILVLVRLFANNIPWWPRN